MPEYSAGQAFLQIVPSFKGVVESISSQAKQWGDSAGTAFATAFNSRVREETGEAPLGPSDEDSTEEGNKSGGLFADAFKARVEAALQSLPNARIDADSTDAERKIADIRAELETLSSKRIGVDISDDEALAKLAVLRLALVDIHNQSSSISIKTDMSEAIGELDSLAAAASDAGADITDAAQPLQAVGGFGGGPTTILAVAAALLVLGAALAPIAGLAAGGLAALPTILAGAGLGAAALKLGLSGIPEALTAYSAAQNTAGESAATVAANATAANKAMAGLTPQGRSFVIFLSGLKSQFDGLKSSTQSALLPGLQSGLQAMEPLFKAVQPFIIGAAKGIGSFAAGLGKILGSNKSISDLTSIFRDASGFMTELGKSVLIAVPAFETLGKQAGPIVKLIGKGLEDMAKTFSHWVASGGFQKFVQWFVQNGPTVAHDVGSIVGSFASFIGILAKIGVPLLNFLGWISRLTIGLDQGVLQALGLVWHALDHLWDGVDRDVVQPVTKFFGTEVPQLVDTVVSNFEAMPGKIAKFFENFFDTVWGSMKSSAEWLDLNVWQPTDTFFRQIPGNVAKAFVNFWNTAWADLADVATWLDKNVWSPIKSFFSTLSSDIDSWSSGMWDGIKSAFDSVMNGIADVWNNTIGKISFTIPKYIPFIGGSHFSMPTIPHYAGGGPIQEGTTAVVGEAGEELFVAPSDGYIFPNSALPNLNAFNPSRSNFSVPLSVTETGGSSAPAVAIAHATFQKEADAEGLLRQASFIRKSRQL